MFLFGTDGMRGRVNQPPITPETVLKFGMAAGIFFASTKHRTKVLIAKDTRLSGYLIEYALTSGLVSVGVDVILLGPMPTPAVAMLNKSLRADFGIMISASHNPYYDNGIKIFDKNGSKITDHCELAIQNLILSTNLMGKLALPSDVGRVTRLEGALGRYIEFVKNSFPKNKTLSGLKIVLDCANGAAYKIAPTILWELGADVVSMGCEPNGVNINENCGSIYPELMAKKVVETGADIGIAIDGDADRIVICDENGSIISGDHLIAAIALYMKQINVLKGGIVVNHMSNQALDHFLNEQHIAVYRSQIGDRHVASTMQEKGCNLGGEQSGHIILNDYSTSGDAVIAALQTLALLSFFAKKTSYIGQLFISNPQEKRNIKYNKINPLKDHAIEAQIEKIKHDHQNLTIVVRTSGTEKLIRVMVEGKENQEVCKVADAIEKLIKNF